MKTAIATLLITSTLSAPALAWSDREQGALLGLIIGGAIASHRAEQRPINPPVVVYQQPQVIMQPMQPIPLVCGYSVFCGPTACYQEPVYNQLGQVYTYRIVCR